MKFSKLNTKTIFLLDGLGAMLSAILLFAILRSNHEYFGITSTILTYLSIIAFIFSCYSITCFFIVKNNWTRFLKIIILANSLYCCLTIGVVLYFYKNITPIGLLYFIAEVIVICSLIFIEMNILKGNSN